MAVIVMVLARERRMDEAERRGHVDQPRVDEDERPSDVAERNVDERLQSPCLLRRRARLVERRARYTRWADVSRRGLHRRAGRTHSTRVTSAVTSVTDAPTSGTGAPITRNERGDERDGCTDKRDGCTHHA